MIAITAHNVNRKEKTLSKTEVLDYAPQCAVTVLLFPLSYPSRAIRVVSHRESWMCFDEAQAQKKKMLRKLVSVRVPEKEEEK